MQGAAGGTDETGTNKDAHRMPVKQWGTLHCVPAACDFVNRVSCALFRIDLLTVQCFFKFASRKFEVMLGYLS